jgi:hypothetical protein
MMSYAQIVGANATLCFPNEYTSPFKRTTQQSGHTCAHCAIVVAIGFVDAGFAQVGAHIDQHAARPSAQPMFMGAHARRYFVELAMPKGMVGYNLP